MIWCPTICFHMHGDAVAGSAGEGDPDYDGGWASYLFGLRASGSFQGGSAIGGGVCARKDGVAPTTTDHLSGFVRVSAASLDDARTLLAGNPVFEAGGTVEIRELTRTD